MVANQSTGSLAAEVQNRIDGIPSSLSTGSIQTFIEFSIADLQNYTGDSIPTTSVPEKYQNILINMGALYTLSRMTGVGVDFDASIGEFSLRKGSASTAETRQMNFLQNQLSTQLKSIGKKTRYKMVFG